MDSPVSKADVTQIRKMLAGLQECETCLCKAEEAGIDCSEIRARKDFEAERLTKLYQVYGSSYPAPKGQ